MSFKKSLLHLLFVLIIKSIDAQNPFVENTHWATSERIDGEFDEITFQQIDSISFSTRDYYQIHFLPEHKFYAFNVPGCGIDCVVQVFGSFSSTDTTTQFVTHKILRIKGCSGDDTLSKDIGTYYWIKDKYSLRLVKSLADEPKENYFKQLNINLADFSGDALSILEKYAYLYNRTYQFVVNKSTQKYDIARNAAANWLYSEAYKSKGVHTNPELYTLVTDLHSKLKELYVQLESR